MRDLFPPAEGNRFRFFGLLRGNERKEKRNARGGHSVTFTRSLSVPSSSIRDKVPYVKYFHVIKVTKNFVIGE